GLNAAACLSAAFVSVVLATGDENPSWAADTPRKSARGTKPETPPAWRDRPAAIDLRSRRRPALRCSRTASGVDRESLPIAPADFVQRDHRGSASGWP